MAEGARGVAGLWYRVLSLGAMRALYKSFERYPANDQIKNKKRVPVLSPLFLLISHEVTKCHVDVEER